MNLHRINQQAEWESSKKLTFFQKVAKKTKGIITPGNVVSATGLILVVVGVAFIHNKSLTLGFFMIMLGRLADVFDGFLAHLSKTKSPLGELIDASFDKIAMLAVFIILLIEPLIPVWILIIIFAHSIINSFSSIWAHARKKRIHPSFCGKLSGAASWIIILGFILASLLEVNNYNLASVIIKVIAYICFAVFIALGIPASVGYFKQAKKVIFDNKAHISS